MATAFYNRTYLAHAMVGIFLRNDNVVNILAGTNNPTSTILRRATIVLLKRAKAYADMGNGDVQPDDTENGKTMIELSVAFHGLLALIRARSDSVAASLTQQSLNNALQARDDANAEARTEIGGWELRTIFGMETSLMPNTLTQVAFDYLANQNLSTNLPSVLQNGWMKTILGYPPGALYTYAQPDPAPVVNDGENAVEPAARSYEAPDVVVTSIMDEYIYNVMRADVANTNQSEMGRLRANALMDARAVQLRTMVAPIAMLVKSILGMCGVPSKQFPSVLAAICPPVATLMESIMPAENVVVYTTSGRIRASLDRLDRLSMDVYPEDHMIEEDRLIELITTGGDAGLAGAIRFARGEMRRLMRPSDVPTLKQLYDHREGRTLLAQVCGLQMIGAYRVDFLERNVRAAVHVSNMVTEVMSSAINELCSYNKNAPERRLVREPARVRLASPENPDEDDLGNNVITPYRYLFNIVSGNTFNRMFVTAEVEAEDEDEDMDGDGYVDAAEPAPLDYPDTLATLMFALLYRQGRNKTSDAKQAAMMTFINKLQTDEDPIYDVTDSESTRSLASMITPAYHTLMSELVNASRVPGPPINVVIRDLEKLFWRFALRYRATFLTDDHDVGGRWARMDARWQGLKDTAIARPVDIETHLSALKTYIDKMAELDGYEDYALMGASMYGPSEQLRRMRADDAADDTPARIREEGRVIYATITRLAAAIRDTSKDGHEYLERVVTERRYMRELELYIARTPAAGAPPRPNIYGQFGPRAPDK